MCWKAVWAHATLTRGYGLDGDSTAVAFSELPPSITAETEDGEDDDDVPPPPTAGWALGAMVVELTHLPWQNTRGRFEAPFWWTFGTLCTLLGLVGVMQFKVTTPQCAPQSFSYCRLRIYVQSFLGGPLPRVIAIRRTHRSGLLCASVLRCWPSEKRVPTKN